MAVRKRLRLVQLNADGGFFRRSAVRRNEEFCWKRGEAQVCFVVHFFSELSIKESYGQLHPRFLCE